jgi:CrcB protein
MYAWIAVAVGGALGSVARHGVNRVVQQEWPLLRFPLGTAMVNVVGCCAIGVLAGLVATGRLPMRATWREFVFVGILGGFTTFSTFGLETITLVRSGETSQAFLNILLQVVCGLAAVHFGLIVVERFGVGR